MDLAEVPEIHMDAETWIRRQILQRILRVTYFWMLIYGSGDMDLAGTLRYIDAETWIGDMDLAEDPEIRIRRHGFCRGSWDTYGCWDMNRRHGSGDVDVDLAENPWDTKMLRHESEDVDLVEDPEIHMAAELWIRQHGSCRGPWDTHGCWDMNPETWILQRSLRHKDVETWIRRCGSCSRSSLVDATTWIGDMTPAEDLEIRSVQKTQTYVL